MRQQYASRHVRDYVLHLSYALRIGAMQGYDSIYDIAALLAFCEPLETVDGLRQVYLHIGYLVYAKRDEAEALKVAEEALKIYREDTRLLSVKSVLVSAQKKERPRGL